MFPLINGWAAVAGTALVVALAYAADAWADGPMILLAASVVLLGVIARSIDRFAEVDGEIARGQGDAHAAVGVRGRGRRARRPSARSAC